MNQRVSAPEIQALIELLLVSDSFILGLLSSKASDPARNQNIVPRPCALYDDNDSVAISAFRPTSNDSGWKVSPVTKSKRHNRIGRPTVGREQALSADDSPHIDLQLTERAVTDFSFSDSFDKDRCHLRVRFEMPFAALTDLDNATACRTELPQGNFVHFHDLQFIPRFWILLSGCQACLALSRAAQPPLPD